MNVETRDTRPPSLERDWWLRVLLVLQGPRAVFAALRDDSDDAAYARQEPLTAVVFLAGIAIFLSTRTASQLIDDDQANLYDGLTIAVEAVVAGALVALQTFWLFGAAVHIGARSVGSTGSYRRSRHLVGLAVAPFALALLVVWPVRLALFGSDAFRSGGSDAGTAGDVFSAIDLGLMTWAALLLLLGVRTLHGWSWPRSLAALALAGVFAIIAAFVAAFLTL